MHFTDLAVAATMAVQLFIIIKQGMRIERLQSKLRFYQKNWGVDAATSRHS
jgi:hypothetical protein